MAVYYKEELIPYTLGRGKVVIAKDNDWADAGDHTLGRLWTDLVHVKEFKITPTSEALEHENFSGGVKRVDRTAIQKQTAKFSMMCDVPSPENLKILLLGDSVDEVAQGSSSLSAVSMTVKAIGKWHEILDASDNNVYNLTSVSVTDDEGVPNALTLDEDYELDAVNGQILFHDDGPLTIAVDDIVKITATIPADTIYEVEGGKNPSQKYHIWYKGDPAEGVIQQVRGWGLFVPTGELSMIGDDWENFTLEGNWLARAEYGKLGFKYRELGTVVTA